MSDEKDLFDGQVDVKTNGWNQSYLVRLVDHPFQTEDGVITCASLYAPTNLRVYKERVADGDVFVEIQRIFPHTPSKAQKVMKNSYVGLLLSMRDGLAIKDTEDGIKTRIVRIPSIKEGKLYLPGDPEIHNGDFDRELAMKNLPLDDILNGMIRAAKKRWRGW